MLLAIDEAKYAQLWDIGKGPPSQPSGYVSLGTEVRKVAWMERHTAYVASGNDTSIKVKSIETAIQLCLHLPST